MEWSDKDMEKLLTDSPWAGKATMTHERRGRESRPGAGLEADRQRAERDADQDGCGAPAARGWLAGVA